MLRTYKEIAAARAEYFNLHMKDIHEAYDWFYYRPEVVLEKVSDSFESPSDSYTHTFNKQLGDLTPEEWEEISRELPEDYWLGMYRWKRNEIDEWRRNFSKEKTLTYEEIGASLFNDLATFPRWFIGYVTDQAGISADDESWLSKLVANQGSGDPLLLGQKVDWPSMCGYLVLYPDTGMHRILPYLFLYHEEGSSFFPINEEDINNDKNSSFINAFYKPEEKGVQTISRSLLARIEESLGEIDTSWDATASDLKSHPYLQWERERNQSIDDHIHALLDRTRRIKRRKK